MVNFALPPHPSGVNHQPLPVQKSNWRFPNQQKVFGMKPEPILEVEEMSQLSFVLLIATGLFFTAYFGRAAWRLSDDSHVDVTGQIGPATR
jgi:hypothetical protein